MSVAPSSASTSASGRIWTAPTFWLDVAERLLAGGLYAFLCWRFLTAFQQTGDPVRLLLLLAEGLILLFILIRRWTGEMSLNPMDWAIALAGTCLPLLVAPEPGVRPLVSEWISAPLFLLGVAVQLSAKIFLFRSFGVLPANRGVMRGGPYRLVRHPMYAGYFISYAAFLLIVPSLWNLTIYALAVAFQLLRIEREERLLSRDPAYEAFKASTRWRLVPGFY